MSKVEFKLNLPGLNELMKSPEMQACLQEAGDAVAQLAGEEYGVRVHDATFVSIANVYPETEKAAKENYENNTLVKALWSVGLSAKGGG